MAIQLQIRRGTTAENDVFTGAVGELTMDTDTNGVRVHDGTTTGGIKIPTEATADYVVEWQAPTDLNNYTWYRKYKSGWVEQGGRGKTNISVTLPVAMANSNYTVSTESLYRHNGGTGASDITTTSFIPRWQQYNASSWGSGNYDVSWQVSGMAT